jgi:hypothetical protein
MYSSKYYLFLHWMEVSYQIHAPTALTHANDPAMNEDLWAPEPDRNLYFYLGVGEL